MIVAAGVAFAIILIALYRRGVSNEELVSRISKERDPRVVAAGAEVLARRGMVQTAEALLFRARSLPQGASTGLVGAQSTLRPPRAPLRGVSDEAWSRFVQAIADSVHMARSPGGRLGKFGIHLHRLADIDWVTSVRSDEDGRVEADWVPPLTEARFLLQPQLQYRALVATMRRLHRHLLQYGMLRPAAVDGRRVSLSGLLAVAHILGAGRVKLWLISRAERMRQRNATHLFEQCNDLF